MNDLREERIALDITVLNCEMFSGRVEELEKENQRLAGELSHWTAREELAQRQFNQLLTDHDNIGSLAYSGSLANG